MTIYLTIITTVLVLTQIIRLIQNAIQLKGMKEIREINRDLMKEWNIVLDKFNKLIENIEE
jgi:hypothetical protein